MVGDLCLIQLDNITSQMKAEKTKISLIDQIVIVEDSGETYSTFTDAFKQLGFKNAVRNSSFRDGTACVVFGDREFEVLVGKSVRMLALRDFEGNESLIRASAVKVTGYSIATPEPHDAPDPVPQPDGDHILAAVYHNGRYELMRLPVFVLQA